MPGCPVYGDVRSSVRSATLHLFVFVCERGLKFARQLGNGTGNPAGIASATRTRPVAQPYPQPHRFTHQKESKNVQIGPELKEIQPILMNFAKLAVTPSVLVQKLCFWTRLKAHG